uniref:SUN domain-containing protein n=1 Tax=Eptatretus burgeri TaxID=7764 RepID=A0A8C4X0G3_EPTBU
MAMPTTTGQKLENDNFASLNVPTEVKGIASSESHHVDYLGDPHASNELPKPTGEDEASLDVGSPEHSQHPSKSAMTGTGAKAADWLAHRQDTDTSAIQEVRPSIVDEVHSSETSPENSQSTPHGFDSQDASKLVDPQISLENVAASSAFASMPLLSPSIVEQGVPASSSYVMLDSLSSSGTMPAVDSKSSGSIGDGDTMNHPMVGEVQVEQIPMSDSAPHVKPELQPEDIPSFDEWKKKVMEEEKEKQSQTMQSPDGAYQPNRKTQKNLNNYASVECGAKILASNAEAQGKSAILMENKDLYMLNPCSAKVWFVIELCEPIQVKQIDIANFELFSSTPRDFLMSISDRYPTRDWTKLGVFHARDERTVQSFPLDEQMFAKFLKVELLSRFGTEHYCPLSLLRVFGTSMVEEYEEDVDPHYLPEVPDIVDEELDVPAEIGGKMESGSKNILGSATDALFNMVNMAAKVLGGNPEAGTPEHVDNVSSNLNVSGEFHNSSTSLSDTKDSSHFGTEDPQVEEPASFPVESNKIVTMIEEDASGAEVTDSKAAKTEKLKDEENLEPQSSEIVAPQAVVIPVGPEDDMPVLLTLDERKLLRLMTEMHLCYSDQRSSCLATFRDFVTLTCSARRHRRRHRSLVISSSPSNVIGEPYTPTSDMVFVLPQSNDGAQGELEGDINATERNVSESLAVEDVDIAPSLDCLVEPSLVGAVEMPCVMTDVDGNDFDSSEMLNEIVVQKTLSLGPSSSSLPLGGTDMPVNQIVDKVVQSAVTISAETSNEEEASRPDIIPSEVFITEMENLASQVPQAPSGPLVNSLGTSGHHVDLEESSDIAVKHTTEPTPLENVEETIAPTAVDDGGTVVRGIPPPDFYAESHNGSIEVGPSNGNHGHGSGQKESVFMRLNNRIKALEVNLSLSSRYLEELSQRYRKQMEEMQKAFNKTIIKLQNTSRSAQEQDQKQSEAIGVLQGQLGVMMDTMGNLTETVEKLQEQVSARETALCILELLCIFLFLALFWQCLGGQTVRDTTKSTDVVNHCLPHKRPVLECVPAVGPELDRPTPTLQFPGSSVLNDVIIVEPLQFFQTKKAKKRVKPARVDKTDTLKANSLQTKPNGIVLDSHAGVLFSSSHKQPPQITTRQQVSQVSFHQALRPPSPPRVSETLPALGGAACIMTSGSSGSSEWSDDRTHRRKRGRMANKQPTSVDNENNGSDVGQPLRRRADSLPSLCKGVERVGDAKRKTPVETVGVAVTAVPL